MATAGTKCVYQSGLTEDHAHSHGYAPRLSGSLGS